MTVPSEVVVFVRRAADEFLAVHRSSDRYWHVVAGTVEPGEDAAEAAARELEEETGLARAVLIPLGVEMLVKQDGSEAAVAYYATDVRAGWEPVLNREHDDYRWCSCESAGRLLRWPEPKSYLKQLAAEAPPRP